MYLSSKTRAQVLASLLQHAERMANDEGYRREFAEAAEAAIRAVNELAEERRHASAISPELRRAPCDC